MPLIPRRTSGSFLAQVRTENATDQTHPWYLIAVSPSAGGQWKIAFVTFGGYASRPPLHKLTAANGYTAALTSSDTRRFSRLAEIGARYANRHGRTALHTSYGAAVTVHNEVHSRDGVFGLRLPSGDEFVCFTLHTIATYSLASGLAQGQSRDQWGALLEPGAYSKIAIDSAQPFCVVGSGLTNKAGALWLKYDLQVVGTTGTPLNG